MRGRARAFLVVLVLVACTPAASPSPDAGVPRLGAGWHDLPDGPLSERQTAHALWTGSEVLVVGGSDAPPCPPNADCALPDVPPLRDGAAYDPATQTWRAIAAAPLPLGKPLPDPPRERSGSLEVAAAGSEHVVAGGWVLHVPSGRWVEMGDPPAGPIAGAAGTWAGDRLLVWGGVRWAGMRGDLLDEGWVWLPA